MAHSLEPRVDVVCFSELASAESASERMGCTLRKVRSLRAHPYAAPHDPVAIALRRDDCVVAQLQLVPGQVQIGRARFPMSWGSAWGFDGDPRNRAAAGLLLLRALREATSFGGVGISEEVWPIYQAAGFDRATLTRYVLPFRTRPILRAHLGRLAALSGPADVALGLVRGMLALPLRLGGAAWAVERVQSFDEAVARVDRRARGDLYFPRDAVELNWARENPWLGGSGTEDRYEQMGYQVRDWKGVVVGYALARLRFYPLAAGYRELTLGSVLRFTVDPDATGAERALLLRIARDLRHGGADALEVCTEEPRLARLARRLGARPVGHLRAAVKLGGEAARALAAHGATLSRFAIDMGDGDMIFG